MWAHMEASFSEGRDVNEFLTDKTTESRTLLHMAADADDWEAVHALLAAGATVDAVMCFGGCFD